MSTERKVAVITGASQGISAALVKAYRDRKELSLNLGDGRGQAAAA